MRCCFEPKRDVPLIEQKWASKMFVSKFEQKSAIVMMTVSKFASKMFEQKSAIVKIEYKSASKMFVSMILTAEIAPLPSADYRHYPDLSNSVAK